MRGPSDKGLGSELTDMFARINRKRRASTMDVAMGTPGQSATTPAGDHLESFGGYDDFGVEVDAGDFNQDRFDQFQAVGKYTT